MSRLPNITHGRPNDERGFVHKTIGRIIGGGLSGITGGPVGIIKGAVEAAVRPTGQTQVQQIVSQPPLPLTGVPTGRCSTGFFLDPRTGQCQALAPVTQVPGFRGAVQRFLPGGETGFVDFGAARMGRFGAGLEPGIQPIQKRVCPTATVLGKDGLCYNRRDIRNSERAWPRGRRPLLTGGEMRCITIAAQAARKMQNKQKQLQDLGVLKKPTPRLRRKALPAVTHTYSHTDES